MLYTDVWVSMGEEVDFKSRIDLLLPYQINADLLARRKIQMSSLCTVSQLFMISPKLGEIYEQIWFSRVRNHRSSLPKIPVISSSKLRIVCILSRPLCTIP